MVATLRRKGRAGSMIEQRIGLIGAGQMGKALVQGLLRTGMIVPDRLLAADIDEAARKRFADLTGVAVVADNTLVAARADLIVLAVKPQQVADLAAQLRGKLSEKHLLLSLAAGVRLASLAEWFGPGVRLVRAMPNAACLIGRGVCGYCPGPGATAEDSALVEQLLGSLGAVWQMEERLLDAVTALAASGIAFVCLMLEALSDGGVGAGLPRPTAVRMAAETMRGAAEMVLSAGEHPAQLKDRIVSPAGTTIAGLQVLEAAGVRGMIIAAVLAAERRAAELAGEKSDLLK